MSIVSNVFFLDCAGDTPTATVSNTTGLGTMEAYDTAVFTVVLDARPTARVTIGLVCDTHEGTLSSSSLSFVPMRWKILQTVTVTGVDEVWVDGDFLHTITTSDMSSDDTNFNGGSVADVLVTNIDGNYNAV
jgi:hypothetical protein